MPGSENPGEYSFGGIAAPHGIISGTERIGAISVEGVTIFARTGAAPLSPAFETSLRAAMPTPAAIGSGRTMSEVEDTDPRDREPLPAGVAYDPWERKFSEEMKPIRSPETQPSTPEVDNKD